MIHKGKQIAALAIGLIVLGSIATWDEWQTKQDEKSKETKGLIITDVRSEDVTSISYLSRGDSSTGGDKSNQGESLKKQESAPISLAITRKDGRWIISDPVSTNADNQTVNDLLKNILEYKSESEVADGKDKWPNFGLEMPRRKIDLETSTGKKLSFFVGNNTPVGFNVYVATNANEKVFSGSQYIATATHKSLFDFRDKKILSAISSPDIKSLTIVSKQEKTKLEKIDYSWELTAPTKAKADAVAVNNLLDDLTALKAQEIFDSPDVAKKTLISAKNELAELTIELPSTTLSMKFFDAKDEIYVTLAGQPTLFKIGAENKAKILKTANDLRDKKIFSFQSADISSVTVDGESFKKVANDWYKESDAGKFSADGKFSGKSSEKPQLASHIRGLVVDLEYARAEEILEDQGKLKLPKAPKHQLVLNSSSTMSPITIHAWLGTGADAETIWMKKSDSNKIYKVKKSVLASLTPQSSQPPVGDELTEPSPEVSN